MTVTPAEDFREDVARGILQALEGADLQPAQKRRIERVMRGGWFQARRREAIITATIEEMHAHQMIAITPDGVQAAVDWDAILAFIEKLIPLIIQLITLFGG